VGHLLSAAFRQASLLAVQHRGRLPRVCRAREQARGSADPALGSAVRDFGVRPAVLSCTSWAPPVIVGLDSRDTRGPKVRARSGGRLLKATSRRPKSEVCATHYRLSLPSGTTTACRARKDGSSRCRTPSDFGVRPAVLSCTSWAPPVIVGLDSRDTPGPEVRARSGGRLLKATSRRPKSEVCATHYRLSLAQRDNDLMPGEERRQQAAALQGASRIPVHSAWPRRGTFTGGSRLPGRFAALPCQVSLNRLAWAT